MTNLQQALHLSLHCMAACDAGDFDTARRLMRKRDHLVAQFGGCDRDVWSQWADRKLSDAEVAAILAHGAS